MVVLLDVSQKRKSMEERKGESESKGEREKERKSGTFQCQDMVVEAHRRKVAKAQVHVALFLSKNGCFGCKVNRFQLWVFGQKWVVSLGGPLAKTHTVTRGCFVLL